MIKENIFPKIEEKILKFWKERKIFERSLNNRKKGKKFVFFEGPPTANGKPGMHHFFGRVVKDLFNRYKTMRGFYALRKGGWDTHGLPVEIEVEKELGLKDKTEVEKYGVGKFNAMAKKSVWKYKDLWEKFTDRIGFWIDLDDPYVTYDWKYMESLWWVMGQINKKGLLYKGHKILPWCPRCGTALSSHEVAQGYKDVSEPSVFVKFKIKNPDSHNLKDNSYILAWTTTPWTLPGNVALAVGEKIKYLLVKNGPEYLIVAEDAVVNVKKDKPLDVVAEFTGKDLVGIEYEPLFDIKSLESEKSYKVYGADFVTTQEGTGVVHTAVMYGEDDYQLGKNIGLPMHHTVNEQGLFTEDVKGFEGKYVKDADKEIINYLDKKGFLYDVKNYEHSYPFCWRCKSPLIYYAKDSWFVAMSKIRDNLLKNNNKINWVPENLKEGRFGEFLRDVKDWAFSRERFWGTPLPVWECGKCEEHKVISSLEDLDKNRYREKNTFYILRHGTSEKNNIDGKDIIASRLENDSYDLLPEGIKEVEEVAKKLKKEGGVDYIYASPFKRTQHSAHIVASVLGKQVHTDDRLKELDHGSICEGKNHYACIPENINRTLDMRYGDGETWREAKARMFLVVKELDDKHEGKKFLLVSHGDPIWLLSSALDNLSDEEMLDIRKKNYPDRGELRKFEFKNYPYNEGGSIDLHRPYVDEVSIKCPKCKEQMKRVPEVVDVWFDSGSMPYAQWHYPFENKKVFEDNFPADFIAEGIDQTRGWFYTLLAVSSLLDKGFPYKNVLSYSHVLDDKGKKMSKSLGNAVDPHDIIEQFGADAGRWYFYTVNNPGETKLFSLDDVKKNMNGFLTTLVNTLRFLELYGGFKEKTSSNTPQNILDEWVLSRLNRLKAKVGNDLDDYNYTASARAIEDFVVNDLSKWWLRRSRGRFQKPEDKVILEENLRFFRHLLIEVCKLLAPFTPFIADHIYKKISDNVESVHLEDWPHHHKKFESDDLEEKMVALRDVVALGLAQRKEKEIKVRQPLMSVSVKMNKKLMPFGSELEGLIKEELNVKKVIYNTTQEDDVILDTNVTTELKNEGIARDIIRYFQDMRKEAGYNYEQKVRVVWYSESDSVVNTFSVFSDEIKEASVLSHLEQGKKTEEAFDVEKEFEIENQKVWIGIKK
ncbi:MAG: isoleucine--tRNA ligase [Candidatus Yanofskybacteria bacterium CG10_big_fil_rev_8_21_14_0_10_36_16]|uniref:Isoleucine--tRNA ligase n=1 Tax=Candidatus Yanofskybacteria bacterium CG10_big_fil_rev_8_21_14_0_10_36_16 TaxID=1975096 RepID=A0A2J0Q7U0_9BACT|nr:MAG: isoleucine--tRNA ligase [Candidatus Yanofskybacteria bacterium CG10_big_fil_rev_8_21_14_0_10_36_16]